jgi:predicted amidohydrolase
MKTLTSLLFKTEKNNYDKNLQTLLKLVNECKEDSIIVAPEVCLTSYDYDNFQKVLDFADVANEELKKVSKNKIIILTMLERRNEKVFNFAKIFYNGEIV